MNKLVITLKVCSLILFFSLLNIQSAQAVVAVKNVEKSEISKVENSKTQLTKKQLRKKQRFEKRLKKFQKRWERKSQKRSGVLSEPKFRLGLIFLIGGVLVALLDFLPFVGWLIGLIAGLLVVVGLVLMIWSLVENM